MLSVNFMQCVFLEIHLYKNSGFLFWKAVVQTDIYQHFCKREYMRIANIEENKI